MTSSEDVEPSLEELEVPVIGERGDGGELKDRLIVSSSEIESEVPELESLELELESVSESES